MNMNKALQHLYQATSGSTTTKVNISKLLCDIHYAITGKESANKNNWGCIIDSMATNWPSGGGGSSDFSTAKITFVGKPNNGFVAPFYYDDMPFVDSATITEPTSLDTNGVYDIVLYKGQAIINTGAEASSVSGNIEALGWSMYSVTGDCTITV